MNIIGVIKIILAFEMMKGNPTLDQYKIDAIAAQINSRIGYLPTETPVSLILSEIKYVLADHQVVL